MNIYDGFQNRSYQLDSMFGFNDTWIIITVLLALVGGILAYFFYISKKDYKSDNKFLSWLHEFLNFKKMFIEVLLKVGYAISAIYITLFSFVFITSNALYFFGTLIIGNLILRLIYEIIMLFIKLVSNTSEINKKLTTKK